MRLNFLCIWVQRRCAHQKQTCCAANASTAKASICSSSLPGQQACRAYVKLIFEASTVSDKLMFLQAVQTIHEARIVHSDLKPANFLMVEGQLKLIDFGIAKAISSDTTSIARESQVSLKHAFQQFEAP